MKADLARQLPCEKTTDCVQALLWGQDNGDGELGQEDAGGREHVERDVYIVIGKEWSLEEETKF